MIILHAYALFGVMDSKREYEDFNICHNAI